MVKSYPVPADTRGTDVSQRAGLPMGETKAQRLTAALDAFLATSPEVEAAAVVSFDGLTMASSLPEEFSDDRVGAMSAALLSLGEQAARGLGRGELRQLFAEADGGYVFLMSARDEAVLVAITGIDAKIGLVLYEMGHSADEIGDLLAAGAIPDDEEEPEPEFEPVRAGPAEADGARVSVPVTPTGTRSPFGDSELDDPFPAYANGRGDDTGV